MLILLAYPAAIAFVTVTVAITVACTRSASAAPRDPRRPRRRRLAAAALFVLGFVAAMPVMALVSFAGVVKRR